MAVELCGLSGPPLRFQPLVILSPLIVHRSSLLRAGRVQDADKAGVVCLIQTSTSPVDASTPPVDGASQREAILAATDANRGRLRQRGDSGQSAEGGAGGKWHRCNIMTVEAALSIK